MLPAHSSILVFFRILSENTRDRPPPLRACLLARTRVLCDPKALLSCMDFLNYKTWLAESTTRALVRSNLLAGLPRSRLDPPTTESSKMAEFWVVFSLMWAALSLQEQSIEFQHQHTWYKEFLSISRGRGQGCVPLTPQGHGGLCRQSRDLEQEVTVSTLNAGNFSDPDNSVRWPTRTVTTWRIGNRSKRITELL